MEIIIFIFQFPHSYFYFFQFPHSYFYFLDISETELPYAVLINTLTDILHKSVKFYCVYRFEAEKSKITIIGGWGIFQCIILHDLSTITV